MKEKEALDIRSTISNCPLDFLEAIVVSENNHETLKDIIFRAEIKEMLYASQCDEYDLLTTTENLQKLQEYALEVYLNQSRELHLSYEKTLSYLTLLLNQNMPARNILALSPNEFIDEIYSYLPRKGKKKEIKVKNRGEMIHYIMEYHPSDVVEGCMAMQSHADLLRDVVLQGQIFHMISLEQCKEYRKVTKPNNLQKLQIYAKELWNSSRDGDLSYKKVAENICYLLNHNTHMVKLLAMSPEEFEVKLMEQQELEKITVMQALKELEEIKEMEIIEKTGKIPTLQEVQEAVRLSQEEEKRATQKNKRETVSKEEAPVRGKREIASEEVKF